MVFCGTQYSVRFLEKRMAETVPGGFEMATFELALQNRKGKAPRGPGAG